MVSLNSSFVEQASRPIRLCVLLLAMIAWPAAAPAQTGPQLGQQDRIRIAEARRLADRLGERLWPGWRRTPFPVLLVGDSAEFLLGHRRPDGDIIRLGDDPTQGG
jgi:hypothetical protein